MTSPRVAVPAPLAALLTELVDDAGLFPPAQLDMADAVDAHLRARSGEFRWILGRFVCPVDRLGELAAALPSRSCSSSSSGLDRPVRLSVIGAPPFTVPDDERDERWRVEAIESRLTHEDVAAAADAMVASARSLGATRAWLEIPWAEFPTDQWATAAKAIAAARSEMEVEVGLKVRCGGATADAVPPPSILASILVCCRDAGIPVKATAGLHHPFRHPDKATGGMQHGFVNLGLAAALALAPDHRLEVEDVAEILADDADASFTLDGVDALRWRDLSVGTDDVAAARQRLFAGFGSCSFREPVDDLVALGLLPRA